MSMRTIHVLTAALGCMAACVVDAAAADEMSVQVKTTQVRDKGSYLGKPLYELHFGDRVSVLQKEAGWYKVQPVNSASAKPPSSAAGPMNGSPGYVNKSALTTKRVVLKGDQSAQIAASSEDVALAGKGFNDDVERAYKAEHPNLASAYATLDQIERNPAYSPSAQDVNAFRAAGAPAGGAQ